MRPPSEGPSASKVVQSAATTAGETSWGRKQRERWIRGIASTGREPAPAWRPSPRIASLRAEGAGDALAGAFGIAQAAGSWPCTGRADSPRPPRAAIRWSIPPDGPDLAPPRSPAAAPSLALSAPSTAAAASPASRSAPRPRPPKRRLPLAAPRAPRDRRVDRRPPDRPHCPAEPRHRQRRTRGQRRRQRVRTGRPIVGHHVEQSPGERLGGTHLGRGRDIQRARWTPASRATRHTPRGRTPRPAAPGACRARVVRRAHAEVAGAGQLAARAEGGARAPAPRWGPGALEPCQDLLDAPSGERGRRGSPPELRRGRSRRRTRATRPEHQARTVIGRRAPGDGIQQEGRSARCAAAGRSSVSTRTPPGSRRSRRPSDVTASSTTSTSPSLTAWASLQRISFTVPPSGASTGISIFIDSRMTRMSPGDHLLADLDLDLPHGAGDVRRDVRHRCCSSLSVEWPARACFRGSACPARPRRRPRSRTMRRCSGMLVLMPSTVEAAAAPRSERAMASLARSPETISLAIIGS